MTKQKSAKRALLLSALSLLMCVSMLIGSTFAWFTDSVTSAGNKIVAGTLNIDMSVMDENGKYQSVKENSDAIFGYTLWEPGYTEWKNIKVSTTGNLALKYAMNIAIKGERSILADVIDVYYAASEIIKPKDRSLEGLTHLGTIREVLDSTTGALINDTLIPDQNNTEDYATIVLKMRESAGNDYQGKTIGEFDIQILATQFTYENDSFGNQYDKDATYPQVVTGTYDGEDTITAGDVSVTLPVGAEEGVYSLKVDNLMNNTDATGQTTLSLNIDLLKNGNKVTAEPGVTYAVDIYVGKNVNVTDVKHEGESITDFTYDMDTGIVSFNTDSFSPFEIVYKTLAAKVGNNVYYTIDDAIANWTNNTTLTLLSDVTLSDVIQLKSTEHHILDLGTSKMTAANGKNAIEIVACGTGDAERNAITIKADATNPGTLDAGKKSVVYYDYSKGGISGNDRPIIKVEGGIFYGSTSSFGTAGFYAKGSAARKCATFNFSGGIFNCSVLGANKSKLLISGGTYHSSVSSQGDSTALRLISGGTFKTLGFMTADSNNTKFWIGTTMGVSDVGVYVNKDGYLVVGGPVITEFSAELPAKATDATKWSTYLQYSSAATNGLYYEDATMAIEKHGEANVELYN